MDFILDVISSEEFQDSLRTAVDRETRRLQNLKFEPNLNGLSL